MTWVPCMCERANGSTRWPCPTHPHPWRWTWDQDVVDPMVVADLCDGDLRATSAAVGFAAACLQVKDGHLVWGPPTL